MSQSHETCSSRLRMRDRGIPQSAKMTCSHRCHRATQGAQRGAKNRVQIAGRWNNNENGSNNKSLGFKTSRKGRMRADVYLLSAGFLSPTRIWCGREGSLPVATASQALAILSMSLKHSCYMSHQQYTELCKGRKRVFKIQFLKAKLDDTIKGRKTCLKHPGDS